MDELSARRVIEVMPRLRRFAYGMCGDLSDADDLVQLTCERAIKRFAQWRRGTSLENWLFAILRNAYLDLYRSRKVRAAHAAETRATDAQSIDGAQVAEDGVLVAQLVVRLADIAEDQRSALLLALVEGLTFQEIADIQGVPVGTVTSRIGRARQMLRLAMAAGPDQSETQEGAGNSVFNCH